MVCPYFLFIKPDNAQTINDNLRKPLKADIDNFKIKQNFCRVNRKKIKKTGLLYATKEINK